MWGPCWCCEVGTPPTRVHATSVIYQSINAIVSVYQCNQLKRAHVCFSGSDWASNTGDQILENGSNRVDAHMRRHDGVGLVLITDIDQLDNPTKLLWKLCDDDMAPHKKVI